MTSSTTAQATASVSQARLSDLSVSSFQQHTNQNGNITTLAQNTLSNPPQPDVEDIQEHEIEIISTRFSEIPSDSCFADTDLIVFKDDFSGYMPLNGIKESELHTTEQLFKEIQESKNQLEIDKTDAEFSRKVENDIKKLLTRKIGRALINQLSQSPNKISIVKSVIHHAIGYEKTTPCCSGNKIVHNPDLGCWVIGMTPSGQRGLFFLPPYLVLGHEMVHACFPVRGDIRVKLPPTLGKEFDNLEEQAAITGYDLDGYQEMNEWNLTAAFMNNSTSFYVRMGHQGLGDADKTNKQVLEKFIYQHRVTAHPIMEKKVASLKEQLSQFANLPAPENFIIDCYLWLNTLNNQYSLEALLNSLKKAKILDPEGLNKTIFSFQRLKQLGNWNQEAIDQLFSDLFKSLRKNTLQHGLDSIPETSRPVFDKIFKPYIDNFNSSSPVLTSSIEEELIAHLIQEKDPKMNSLEDDDAFNESPLKIDDCESLLRLIFVRNGTEKAKAQELICNLVKATQYCRNPGCSPMTFLQTLKSDLNIRSAKFFFGPTLKEAMKSFLQQLSEGQEAISFLLFEDLFNHPETLMQEFQEKHHSYADIFLNYLSAHPDKIAALSNSEEQQFAAKLIEKLKACSKS